MCDTNHIQLIIFNEKPNIKNNDIFLSDINPNNQQEDFEQNDNNFSFNTLKCSMMKFSLHYYAKLNFSKKDALQLQRDITKIIMCPIAQQINNILENNKTIDINTKKALELIIFFY